MSFSSTSGLLNLVFEPDNPCNTNVHDAETGEALYHIGTEHTDDSSVTKVINEEARQIASWVWNDVRSDILTLGDAKPISASGWLRKSMIPFKSTVEFKDLQGRTFKWKGNEPGASLQLFYEGDKKSPVASFRKHYKYKDIKTGEQVDTPATLTIAGVGKEIVDLIVISFCLLEKKRRMEENGTVTLAASSAIPETIHNIKVK